jgi:hypothetical protein
MGEKGLREKIWVSPGGGGGGGSHVQEDQNEDGKMKLLQRKIQDRRRPKENGKMDLLKRTHVHKDPK